MNGKGLLSTGTLFAPRRLCCWIWTSVSSIAFDGGETRHFRQHVQGPRSRSRTNRAFRCREARGVQHTSRAINGCGVLPVPTYREPSRPFHHERFRPRKKPEMGTENYRVPTASPAPSLTVRAEVGNDVEDGRGDRHISVRVFLVCTLTTANSVQESGETERMPHLHQGSLGLRGHPAP